MDLCWHINEYLVVTEYNSKYLLKIIDLKNNTIQRILRKGRGPNELLSASDVGVYGGVVYVYDVLTKRIITLKDGNDRKFKVYSDINIDKAFFSVKMSEEDELVALGWTESSNRVTKVNLKDQTKKEFGDFYKLKNSNGDNEILYSLIGVHPKENKFVLACTKMDMFEIYSNDKLTRRVIGPLGVDLRVRKIKVGGGYMNVPEPNISNYECVDCNDKEIWLGYSGVKLGKEISDEETLPKNIYCFSWDGKPVKRINTKFGFRSFAVDWKKEKIYFLMYDPEPRIIVCSIV